jgi:AraC-like DNA-binding protein
MLLLTNNRAVRPANNVPNRLAQLHAEASLAVARLNEALRVSSRGSIQTADLAPRYELYAPASSMPIMALATKPVPRQGFAIPPKNEELARTARRLGMSESEIARRFGAVIKTKNPTVPKPATPTLTLEEAIAKTMAEMMGKIGGKK